MRPRTLSLFRHPFTTRQALGSLLDLWRENQELPVILITEAGSAERFTRSIRVALSKERKKYPKDSPVHYGFVQSDPFPYTDSGIRGEAVVLHRRITELQKIRNQLSDFNDVPIGNSFPGVRK